MPKHKNDHSHDEPQAVGRIPELHDADGPIWVNKFTEDSARAFVKQLQYQSKQDPNSPILIYVDSDGGDVYALMAMVSAMEAVPNKIITCALSKAFSAGAVLLACGDVRYASEHSEIMVHEVSGGAIGHIDDINIQYASIAKTNEKFMRLLVKKCNYRGGYAALKKVLANSRDLYLSPEEAIKFGLVDHVGVPMLFKNLSVQYQLSLNPRGNNNGNNKTKD